MRGPAPLLDSTVTARAIANELPLLHEALARFWLDLAPVGQQDLARPWQLLFEIAVMEIANNIVQHGNLDPNAPGPVVLRLRAYADRITATFLDWGAPYAGRVTAAPLVEGVRVADLPERGFGLAMARDAVDRLTYARAPDGGNTWLLVKYLPGHG